MDRPLLAPAPPRAVDRAGASASAWITLFSAGVFLAGCGTGRSSAAGGGDGGTRTYHPDASCLVTIQSPPVEPGIHVPIGTDIQYDSNPPSSGQHYPIWAKFQIYDSPVPRGYYVHDLEHGAVVLLENCGGGGCPDDVVTELQSVTDAIADDPLCAAAGEGVRVRALITPDPLVDTPIAAAAWGWTYTAACLDVPSLQQFVVGHYGQGPEAICTNGTSDF
ncbi:MAG: DUF3105 domain-containing protein [Myxococcales bacterium]|nr:DUF3105 domain-containing protein [Myxococcales bacterium]